MNHFNPTAGTPATTAKQTDATLSDGAVPAAASNTDFTAGMPAGYVIQGDGIYHSLGDGEEAELVWLCSRFRVVGDGCRGDGTDWGRVVEVIDPDGSVHRTVVWNSARASSPASILRPLAQLGLRFGSDQSAKQAVVDLIARWSSEVRFRFVAELGWMGDGFGGFVLGDTRVIGDGHVHFVGDDPDVARSMRARGNLADWTRTVGAKCEGNPLMVVSVSLAFAGPLLEVLGEGSGGVHLKGRSSRGKSSALLTAASVWGAPDFMLTWRATSNALEALAASRNSSVLILDEIGEASPRDVGQCVYMLGNNKGKARSRSGGGAIPALRWKTSVISSGEVSLQEHMAIGNQSKSAGHEMRLIEVIADQRALGAFDEIHGAKSAKAFAESMVLAATENYGLAGPEFVARLISEIRLCKHDFSVYRTFIDRFCEIAATRFDLPDDGQTLRVLKRFALIALAGTLATGWGLTGWQRGTSKEAALEIFGTWLAHRDAPTKREIGDVVAHVGNHLRTHGNEQFVPLSAGASAATVAKFEGWRDDHWFYFTSDAWTALHGDKASARDAAELMRTAALLRCNNGTGLQFKMPRGIAGRAVTYCVSAKVVHK